MSGVDPTSALKADSLRTVLVLLVPGGTALSSWVCVLFHIDPRLAQASTTNEIASGFLFVLASLACGKVLDGLGSWWEAGVNDRKLAKNGFASFEDDWNAYLRMAFSEEPVGIRYISDAVLSLKFELNQGLSFAVLWLGLWPLAYLEPRLTVLHVLAIATPLAGFLTFVLLYDSYNSSKLLAKTRRELRKGIIR